MIKLKHKLYKTVVKIKYNKKVCSQISGLSETVEQIEEITERAVYPPKSNVSLILEDLKSRYLESLQSVESIEFIEFIEVKGV